MKARVNLPALFFLSALILFVSVQILLTTTPHIFFWDEAVYVGMGKYLFSFGNIGLWEVLRPPLLPLIFGALWKLTSDYTIPGMLLMVAFSAGYAAITYLLARRLFGGSAAALSGIVVLLTPLFFLHSRYLITDIGSTFFMLFSIYLLLDGRYFLGGIVSGLAFLMRFPHGIIVAAVGAALLYPRWREGMQSYGRYLGGFFISLLPFFIFNYLMYYKETSPFYALIRPLIFASLSQGNAFAAEGNSFLFYFIETVKNNPFLFFAFAGIALCWWRKRFLRQDVRLVLFPLFFYFLYFSVIVNKQLRFSLAFLGLLAPFAGFSIIRAFTAIRQVRWRIALAAALLVLATVFLYPALNPTVSILFSEPIGEHPIVGEFYNFFSDRPINGSILTTDPVPAAYADRLFIPYYIGALDPLWIKEQIDGGGVAAVIYTPRSFPCIAGDSECVRVKDDVLTLLSTYPLLLNQSYWKEQYFIFKTK